MIRVPVRDVLARVVDRGRREQRIATLRLQVHAVAHRLELEVRSAGVDRHQVAVRHRTRIVDDGQCRLRGLAQLEERHVVHGLHGREVAVVGVGVLVLKRDGFDPGARRRVGSQFLNPACAAATGRGLRRVVLHQPAAEHGFMACGDEPRVGEHMGHLVGGTGARVLDHRLVVSRIELHVLARVCRADHGQRRPRAACRVDLDAVAVQDVRVHADGLPRRVVEVVRNAAPGFLRLARTRVLELDIDRVVLAGALALRLQFLQRVRALSGGRRRVRVDGRGVAVRTAAARAECRHRDQGQQRGERCPSVNHGIGPGCRRAGVGGRPGSTGLVATRNRDPRARRRTAGTALSRRCRSGTGPEPHSGRWCSRWSTLA